jgi:hypothetical protein
MKRIVIAILLLSLLLSGCGRDESVKHFADGRRIACAVQTELSRFSPLANALEADPNFVIEYATCILLCRIDAMEDVGATRTVSGNDDENPYVWTLNYSYSATAEEVLFAREGDVKQGDALSFSAGSGMVRINDLKHLLPPQEVTALGIDLHRQYSDSDYIATAKGNTIPIEVGKTYLVFLNEEYGYYSDCGFGELYECDGEAVYAGWDMKRSETSSAELIGQTRARIEARSGIFDEMSMYERLEYIKAHYDNAETTEAP